MTNFNEICMVNGKALLKQFVVEEENLTASGIVLPGKKPAEFKNYAVVVLKSEQPRTMPDGTQLMFPAEVGDVVILRDDFGVDPLKVQGVDFKAADASAVLAVIRKNSIVQITETTVSITSKDGEELVSIGK